MGRLMDSVILIRHGQSTANVQRIISSDYDVFPLTEKGVLQTDSMASQLEGARIDGIVSSPVLRAKETSGIIAKRLGINFEVEERIRESGLGKYNNFKLSDLPSKSHKELGMESWESHIERFLSFIGSRKGRHILVSHAYPIRAITSHYLGLGEHESYGIEVRNATATVIDLESNEILCVGSALLSRRVLNFISS